jgi:hypothetical protein
MCACVCTHMNGCIKVCYNMSFCIKGHRTNTLAFFSSQPFCFEFSLMFHVKMAAWRNKQECIKQCQDEDKAHSHSCFLLRAACKGAHIFNKITFKLESLLYKTYYITMIMSEWFIGGLFHNCT